MHLLRPPLSNLSLPFLCFFVFLLVALTMLSRFLFSFGAFVFAGLGMATTGARGMDYIRYSAVTGYFLQDDPATDSSTFDYVRCPISYLTYVVLVVGTRIWVPIFQGEGCFKLMHYRQRQTLAS